MDRDRNEYSNYHHHHPYQNFRIVPPRQNSNRSPDPLMYPVNYEVEHNHNNKRTKIFNYAKNCAKRKQPYYSTRNDDKFSHNRSNITKKYNKFKAKPFKHQNQASTSAGPSIEQIQSKPPTLPLSDVSSDDEASQNMKKMADELNQIRNMYKDVLLEKEHLETLLDIDSESYKNLNEELNRVKNIYKSIILENEDLKSVLEKAEQEKSQIKAENDVRLKNFQVELENQKSMFDKLKSKLDLIIDENKSLKKNLDDESRLNYKLQKENAIFENKISREKEKEIMELRVKHGESMTKLRIEKDEEIEKLKRLQLEKEEDRQYTSTQIEKIMKDLNVTRREVETLKSQKSKTETENGRLKAEVETQANEIIEIKSQYDKRLAKSQTQYQRAIDDLEKKVKETEAQLKAVVSELKGEKQKIEGLNQDIVNLKKENKKVEGYKKSQKSKSDENKKLKKEVKDLKDKLFIETKENERVQCKLRQLGEENNKKNNEIQDFKEECLKRFDKLLPKPIEIE